MMISRTMLLMVLVLIKTMMMVYSLRDHQVMKYDVAKVWKSWPSEPVLPAAALKLCHLFYLCNVDHDQRETLMCMPLGVKYIFYLPIQLTQYTRRLPISYCEEIFISGCNIDKRTIKLSALCKSLVTMATLNLVHFK